MQEKHPHPADTSQQLPRFFLPESNSHEMRSDVGGDSILSVIGHSSCWIKCVITPLFYPTPKHYCAFPKIKYVHVKNHAPVSTFYADDIFLLFNSPYFSACDAIALSYYI